MIDKTTKNANAKKNSFDGPKKSWSKIYIMLKSAPLNFTTAGMLEELLPRMNFETG